LLLVRVVSSEFLVTFLKREDYLDLNESNWGEIKW